MYVFVCVRVHTHHKSSKDKYILTCVSECIYI